VMWRLRAWRGRWSALGSAAAALSAGLATVLFAPTLWVLVLGLMVFGVGMGLTYYTSLYYTLTVGHGAVDAGGSFEALVGLGYCVGPLLGLSGRLLGRGQTPTPDSAPGATITVALVWLAALAAFGAMGRAYAAGRRDRGPRPRSGHG